MKYLEEIYWFISTLQIVSKEIIADWVAFMRWYAEGHSAYVNADKRCKRLVKDGRIVAGDGFYKLPHIKSEYKEHSKALTEHLSEILKLPYQSVIFREKLLEPVKLRPDAMVALIKGNQATVFILEILVNESPLYFKQKISAWKSWRGGKEVLSKMFGFEVPFIQIVTNDNFSNFIRRL